MKFKNFFKKVYGFLNRTDLKAMLIKDASIALLLIPSIFVPQLAWAVVALVVCCTLIEHNVNSFAHLLFFATFCANDNMPQYSVMAVAFIAANLIVYSIQIAKKQRKFNYLFVAIAAIVYIFMIIFAINKLTFTMRFVMLCGIIYLLLENRKETNIKTMGISYIVGLFVVSAISLLLFATGRPFLESSGLIRFQGLTEHPNIFYRFCIMAVGVSYTLYLTKNINTFQFTTLLYLENLLILSSLSKMALMLCIIINAAILITSIVRKNKEGKNLLPITLTIFLSFVVSIPLILNIFGRLTEANMDIINNVSHEANEGSVNTITTGRSELWIHYLKLFAQNAKTILVGNGFGAKSDLTVLGPHCEYIEMLFLFGLIGTFLIFFTIFCLMIMGNKKPKFLNVVVLVFDLLIMFSETQIYCNLFTCFLSLSLMFYWYKPEAKEKDTNSKKRILFLLSTNHYFGAENVVCQIIDMIKDKYECLYVGVEGPIQKTLENKKITARFVKKLNYRNVNKIVKEFKPDIIHANDIKASIVASLFHDECKIVSQIHVNDKKSMNKLSIKSILFNYFSVDISKFIWVSAASLENYKFKQHIQNRSIVLRNIIDINHKLNNSVSNSDVIYVGRLSEQKNPMRLVDIIKLVQNKMPNIKMFVLGDGNLKEQIAVYIEKNNLQNNITLLGYVDDPISYMAKSKLMLMTSTTEGTPMCALEAMSVGIPVATTNTDLAEIISDKNGFVFTTNEEAAQIIIDYLSNSKSKKENCLEFSKAYNNKSNYINALQNVYDN